MHEIRDTSKSTRLCDITMKNKIVCVVGLGYVGLPLNFLASLKPLLKMLTQFFIFDKKQGERKKRSINTMRTRTVCIIGLGYVGLPLAKAFSKHLRIIGYDIDGKKVKRLNESNNEENIEFTSDPSKIKQADFVLICVPTPVTKSKEPDLRYVKLFCFAKTFTKKCLRYPQRKLLGGT